MSFLVFMKNGDIEYDPELLSDENKDLITIVRYANEDDILKFLIEEFDERCFSEYIVKTGDKYLFYCKNLGYNRYYALNELLPGMLAMMYIDKYDTIDALYENTVFNNLQISLFRDEDLHMQMGSPFF